MVKRDFEDYEWQFCHCRDLIEDLQLQINHMHPSMSVESLELSIKEVLAVHERSHRIETDD